MGAASTHIGAEVDLRNRSPRTCSLDGYPEVEMLDANGHALPTHVTDATSAYIFSMQPSLVALAPGASAYFILQWRNVTVSGGGCPNAPTSSSLQITPLGASDAVTVAASLTPCDGNLITSPIAKKT
jgi:hypothetical protein